LNTQEGFFTIRSVFLLRGMMATCGFSSSMVVAWEEDARVMLKEAVGLNTFWVQGLGLRV
jgi:hypothetical protein